MDWVATWTYRTISAPLAAETWRKDSAGDIIHVLMSGTASGYAGYGTYNELKLSLEGADVSVETIRAVQVESSWQLCRSFGRMLAHDGVWQWVKWDGGRVEIGVSFAQARESGTAWLFGWIWQRGQQYTARNFVSAFASDSSISHVCMLDVWLYRAIMQLRAKLSVTTDSWWSCDRGWRLGLGSAVVIPLKHMNATYNVMTMERTLVESRLAVLHGTVIAPLAKIVSQLYEKSPLHRCCERLWISDVMWQSSCMPSMSASKCSMSWSGPGDLVDLVFLSRPVNSPYSVHCITIIQG